MDKLTIYTKSVLQLIAIAIVLYLIYLTSTIIIYFLIAVIISLVAKPITRKIANIKIWKFHIPDAIAAALTIILIIIFVGLINVLILPQFVSELTFLSKIDYASAIKAIENKYQTLLDILASADVDVAEEQKGLKQSMLNFFNINTISSTVKGIAGGLGNVAAATFSILFMLFFFLKERELTKTISKMLTPIKYLDRFEHISPKIKHILGRYFRGLLLQMSGVFILVYSGLYFFAGVENALVIALFAALVNLIPYIGPIIGMAFGIFIGVGQAFALGLDPNYGLLTLKIIAVFGTTQLIDNILFQPIIFSNSVNAHPLEIFLVIALAGTIFVATGMILAIPVYSVIRIFAKEFLPNNRFIQTLTKNL